MHFYSALQSSRIVSAVPGGQEQVRLQCTLKAFCDSSGARSVGSRLFQVTVFCHLPEILGQTDRVRAKLMIFNIFSLIAPQP